MIMAKKIAVIAIGGNSLIKDTKHQSVEDQYDAATETCVHIADMIEAGYEVVIGHGNGPQVGFILRRSEIAAKAEELLARYKENPALLELVRGLIIARMTQSDHVGDLPIERVEKTMPTEIRQASPHHAENRH